MQMWREGENTDPDPEISIEGVAEIARELESASPVRVIDRALAMFEDDVAISFSGAEDVLLIEYAQQTGRPYRVFTLDTGRLHPETYRFFARVEDHYRINIEYVFPETRAVETLVRSKGLFSFYRDGHGECCAIRKVEPLRRQLAGLRAWITGQRRDQNPASRAHVPLVEADPMFKGRGERPLLKWNPLTARPSRDVWDALRALGVPYNELHERGFVSIGCEPCTRAILPGQHERDGRWWWESADKKECGLHNHKPQTRDPR